MTDAELDVLIAPVLRESFGRHGLDDFAVRAGKDHDGVSAAWISQPVSC